MAERSEEDVVLGVLRIEVGSAVKVVPTLKARYAGEWAREVSVPGTGKDKPLGEWSEADIAAMPERNVERLLELIVSYDRTGALGGREWLEENADPAQLREAVVQMLGNANPLADAPVLLDLLLVRAAGRSGQPSSTNGASRSGASTRTKSARGSTRSS